MSQEYKNLPFEEPSFIQNMDSNLKLLLETFMMLDEYKMVVVLKQCYRIVKLLKQNKNQENPQITEKIPKKESVLTTNVENISEDENAPEPVQENTSAMFQEMKEAREAQNKTGKKQPNSQNKNFRKVGRHVYTCELCEASFKNKDHFKRHKKTVHSLKEQELDIPMRCESHCEKVFTKISMFFRHKQAYKEMKIVKVGPSPLLGKN